MIMDLDFNKNEDYMKQALGQLRHRFEKISAGGGPKSVQKQHEKNKLTARERIKYLVDDDSLFFEIGAFAGFEMYEEYGGCPSAGTVAGIGYVSGRQCIILANDQTVKAGAWFPITGKKNLRMQEIAMENHLPVIYLVDSAGVFLPLQDEIFPDKEHFGRIFRNNARMSAMGISQLSVVMGPCVAGGAYLPIMSDETIMAEGNGSIFLAGPYLVKAAIGETTDAESLGGAVTHTSISGIADYKFNTEQECLDLVRKIMSGLGTPANAGFDRIDSVEPLKNPNDIYGIIPSDSTRPYDMLEVINRLVDAPGIQQFKEEYGKTIICGYARIDGWSVGIVANQRTIVKTKKGEVQLGGVIYNDSADKVRPVYHELQSEKNPAAFSSGCYRFYGRHTQ